MQASTISDVGMIGLGLMGSALAERLSECGFRVVGFDIREEVRDALGRVNNAASVSQPGEAFARCDLVLLSLPTHHEVRAVLGQCAGQLRQGQIIVDTTTGDPASSIQTAGELARRGVAYLDGTISGNSVQARKGDVVWMVGGERAAFDRCIGVLEHLGRQVFHTGAAGSGATMKLVTNIALGLNRAALAETLAFAESLGLDATEALRVLKASAAYSRVMDAKGEKMIARDFTPQATLSQHLKDVRLIRAAGAAAGLELPMTATHASLLERAEVLGLGRLDNSAIIEVLRRRNINAESEEQV